MTAAGTFVSIVTVFNKTVQVTANIVIIVRSW